MTFLVFVLWLALAAFVGVFANQRRNRSGFGWFMLALFISPVLAFLLCAAMKENTKAAGYDWRIPPHAQKRSTAPIAANESEPARTASDMPLAVLYGGGLFAALCIAFFCYAVIAF